MKTQTIPGAIPESVFEQHEICISVIVPVHRLSPERIGDPLRVKKAISKAKILLGRIVNVEKAALERALDQLYDSIDFNHNAEGVGLFVAPGVMELVSFHFPVEEKVMVTDMFEIRDWLYELYYSHPYHLLHLNEKDAILYQGKFDRLDQVNDDHFPMKHDDEYSYQMPSRGSSYFGHANVKQFERDKSQLEEIHYTDFLHRVDEVLKSFLHGTPLLVAGSEKDVAYFKGITTHRIAAVVPGSFLHKEKRELEKAAFHALVKWLNGRKTEMTAELQEKIGQRLAVTGIDECWKLAKEGRCLRLLVEKDYSVMGYVNGTEGYNLYLTPPDGSYNILPDAVSTLISNVLATNGEVILVENGSLKALDRIGMITRY